MLKVLRLVLVALVVLVVIGVVLYLYNRPTAAGIQVSHMVSNAGTVLYHVGAKAVSAVDAFLKGAAQASNEQ